MHSSAMGSYSVPMLVLASLLENPGEPAIETRYRDPHELADLGYNGLILYGTTAVSGVASPDVIRQPEMRRWVTTTLDAVGRRIDDNRDAGLDTYLSYDALVLPTDVLAGEPDVTCRGRDGTLCPGSDRALSLSVEALAALLDRFPQAAGAVLRFGDTDANRFPHLTGNDLYTPHCPRCSSLDRDARIVRLLDRFHDLVVRQRDKRLIARAWGVRPGGLHDSPDLAEKVAPQLPGGDDPTDDRFVLSFKFTQTDFWRYQAWNPSSLKFGHRPILYELQCQREFEGKGSIPNWQVPLWRDGPPEAAPPEAADVNPPAAPRGLKEVAERVNLAGLWAWVRGGGWGGPFIKDETWVDANVWAVPKLAADPAAEPTALAKQWATHRLGLDEPPLVEAVVELLRASPAFNRQAFYLGPFSRQKRDPWHPAADWVQDDMLDAEAIHRVIHRLPLASLHELVKEKEAAATEVSHHRRRLQQLLGDRHHASLEPLRSSLLYAESLFEAFRDLTAGLAAYRRWQRGKSPSDADVARRKLFAAQNRWNHHTQRIGSLPGVATPFREHNFWDLTQRLLAELTLHS